MHSVQLEKKIKGIYDAYKRQSIAQCTTSDINGDHHVLPRIGDDYQAEIPPLYFKNEELDYAGKWKNGKYSLDPKGAVSILQSHLDAMPSQYEGLSFSIPESLDEHWSDVESNSFLLGLYMFGKDFKLLRRIVESKTIVCLQSFYYGKFYGSDEHSRWSKIWKSGSRDCLVGEKIFNRCRRSVLLSRLCSHVSNECNLIEVSRRFEDGEISFTEYIFNLKAVVGISLLIEAVGIGKGKQDLTKTALERTKTKYVLSVRPEIPVGQACSNLSAAEIIKFLTGDFRLSKARAGDLFWEAVWPRLLARGWSSEQPEGSILYSQNHSLVFLLPGVDKFTKELVKGKDYFDSVSDVLNKVASEPGLLELGVEEDKGNENNQGRNCGQPVKQDMDDVSNEQGNFYLQPFHRDCKQEPVKFTVVDATFIDGVGQHDIRKLRCLSAQTSAGITSSSISSKMDYSSEKSKDEMEGTDAFSPAKLIADRVASAELSNRVTGIIDNDEHNTSEPNKSVEGDCRTQSANVINDKQPMVCMNYKTRENAKSEQSNHLAPKDIIAGELNVGKPKILELTNSIVPCMSQNCGTIEQTKANVVQNDDKLKLSEQQSTPNNWRHSTRNRLLTVKAWEALEYGFLDPKGKRKGEDGYTGRSTSNRCRRVRRRAGSQACSDIGAHKDSVDEKNLDGFIGNETYIAGEHKI